MPKPFQELQSELLHLFQCLCVAGDDGISVLCRGRKILGVRAAKDRFRKNSTLRAIGSPDDIIFSTVPVFKTIPRSLVVETVDMA